MIGLALFTMLSSFCMNAQFVDSLQVVNIIYQPEDIIFQVHNPTSGPVIAGSIIIQDILLGRQVTVIPSGDTVDIIVDNYLPSIQNCSIYFHEVCDEESLVSSIPNNENAVKEALVFGVFPNPTSDYLQIHSVEGGGRNFEISLYDLNGTIVIHKQWGNSDKAELNLQGFPPGIYLLEIKDEFEVFTSKVFVN